VLLSCVLSLVLRVNDSNLSLIGPGDESVSPCGVHNHIVCEFPPGETDSSPDTDQCHSVMRPCR
jgi:hypothetical protein